MEESLMVVKKFTTTVLLGLAASGCGGGGGGGGESSTTTTPPGIYFGTVTPQGGTPDDAVALITSDGRAALVDTNTIEAFIGAVSGTSLSGTMYSGSSVPASANVSKSSDTTIEGTYASSLGDGSFALVSDPNLYNRGADLSKLSGTWVDLKFTDVVGTTTWVIQSDGSFSMSSTSGCVGSGAFGLINPDKNEYDLSVTVSNCPGANGEYTGFAALSDTYYTDDTISLIFSNGSVGGLFEPIK